MDAAVLTPLPLSVILVFLLPTSLSSARVNVCVLLVFIQYLAQPAERRRCQQFSSSPERKVLTPALLVKAVICVLAADSPRSQPQIRNLNVSYCCLWVKRTCSWEGLLSTHAAFYAVYPGRGIWPECFMSLLDLHLSRKTRLSSSPTHSHCSGHL